MTPEALGELRARLVERLRARGDVRTTAVANAFARVPRHAFVRNVAPEEAYADRSIAIKVQDGVAVSSSSQPAIMAEMLEMLELRPGDRVLEIGTGSGYNAALVAEIVGPSGTVVTIDIDAGLVAAAQQHLAETGYARVQTRCADGTAGDPQSAPFDAVIAAVGVERIPPPWIAQLRDGGRLVAPLTVRSLQKVIAFERTAVGLESRAIVDAAFMMLRGASASSGTVEIPLEAGEITLRVFAGRERSLQRSALGALLRARADERRLQRRVAPEDVWTAFALWLALFDDGFCRLCANAGGPGARIVPSLLREMDEHFGVVSTFGVCDPGAIAVLAARGARDVVLRGFGSGTDAAARVQAALGAWDDAGRPGNRELRVRVDIHGTTHAGYQ